MSTTDTTPRDDISGLSERLRRAVDPFWHHTRNEVITEAATALDALQAKVKELEARARYADETSSITIKQRERSERNRDMWKGQSERQAAQLTSLRADNDKMHDLVDQLTQAHHDAEAKCDDLAQQLKDLRVVTNYNREQAEAAESRATRLQQERNEAYERAAKVAFARAARWKEAMEHEDSPCGMSLYDECLDIGAIIRRLSAGPKKEKKE